MGASNTRALGWAGLRWAPLPELGWLGSWGGWAGWAGLAWAGLGWLGWAWLAALGWAGWLAGLAGWAGWLSRFLLLLSVFSFPFAHPTTAWGHPTHGCSLS
jgi:hypothetical protein